MILRDNYIGLTHPVIYRPSDYATQKICYTGYTKEHDLKYSGVMSPCGIIICLYGPVPGSFHDARMLNESSLIDLMRNNEVWTPTPETGFFFLSCPQIIGPTRHNASAVQKACNSKMSFLRISVEHGFGKVLGNFAFNSYPENLKLELQPIGKYFLVSAFLTNYHTCLNGSQTSDYYLIQPPHLFEYVSSVSHGLTLPML